nr:hypothetical protein [Tanacetum cinerariifolium]GFC67200.1 hypothetical protein [Tanacetum cinerariifolium]
GRSQAVLQPPVAAGGGVFNAKTRAVVVAVVAEAARPYPHAAVEVIAARPRKREGIREHAGRRGRHRAAGGVGRLVGAGGDVSGGCRNAALRFPLLGSPNVRRKDASLHLPATLPDYRPVGRFAHHFIAFLAAEGLGKLRHIHERPDGAVLARRVRVSENLLAQGFGADVLAAQLRPT